MKRNWGRHPVLLDCGAAVEKKASASRNSTSDTPGGVQVRRQNRFRPGPMQFMHGASARTPAATNLVPARGSAVERRIGDEELRARARAPSALSDPT